jgi:hypothetical protein
LTRALRSRTIRSVDPSGTSAMSDRHLPRRSPARASPQPGPSGIAGRPPGRRGRRSRPSSSEHSALVSVPQSGRELHHF